MSRNKRRKRKKYGKPAPLFDNVPQPTERPRQTILRTAQEVANHLGVSLRTVQNWMDGGLREICTPAQPGQHDGYFPVAEIEQWRDRKRGRVLGDSGDPEVEKMKREAAELDLTQKRIKVQRQLGGVIELADAIQLSAKAAAATKAKLNGLRSRLESILPQELDDQLRSSYLNDVDELLHELYNEIGTELDRLAQEAQDKQRTLK